MVAIAPKSAIDVQCFVSRLTNIWTNLAIEEWLFRKASRKDSLILFLWRNDSCVVIGRNQNPWREANVPYLRTNKMPLVRRRSGGGTVYHDLGNTNHTTFIPSSIWTRAYHPTFIADVLKSDFHLPVRVNERNDVVTNNDNKKISGSAYKLITGRAYSHGTLLFNADLERLRRALHDDTYHIDGKGVQSVRSPVTNLTELHHTCDDGLAHLSHDSFCDRACSAWGKMHRQMNLKPILLEPESIHLHMEKEYLDNTERELQDWDWLWGQTPDFTAFFNKVFGWGTMDAKLEVKSGYIIFVKMTFTPTFLGMEEERWSASLLQQKFEPETFAHMHCQLTQCPQETKITAKMQDVCEYLANAV